MVKFLHTSDWQLGMTRRYLAEGSQERYNQARFDAVRTMGRLAKEESCQFMLVCGDVFESNQVDRKTVAAKARCARLDMEAIALNRRAVAAKCLFGLMQEGQYSSDVLFIHWLHWFRFTNIAAALLKWSQRLQRLKHQRRQYLLTHTPFEYATDSVDAAIDDPPA